MKHTQKGTIRCRSDSVQEFDSFNPRMQRSNLDLDWSDNEELEFRHKRLKCNIHFNQVLKWTEIIIVPFTVCSPFLMILLPLLRRPANTSNFLDQSLIPGDHSKSIISLTNRKNIIYEAEFVSLCTKFIVMCFAMGFIYIPHIISLRLNSSQLTISHSRLEKLRKAPHSHLSRPVNNNFLHNSLDEDTPSSLFVYFIIDVLMISSTLIFWFVFISKWILNSPQICSANSQHNSYYDPNHENPNSNLFSQAKQFNPFRTDDQSNLPNWLCELTPDLYQETRHFAFYIASGFVNTHLTIQLTSAFFLRLRNTNLFKACYAVRVVRSVDGASRTYQFGKVGLRFVATYIIHSSFTDFQPCNPWVYQRSRRSQMMNHSRSIFSSWTDLNTSPNHPSGEHDQSPTSRRCFSLKFIRSRQSSLGECSRTDPDEASQSVNWDETASSVSAPRKSIPDRREFKTSETFSFLKAPDLQELNVLASRYLKSQYNYEKSIRKRQLRLELMTENLFSVFQRRDWSKIELGTQEEQLKAIKDSTNYIYQQISGPLMKYLRITKQSAYYSKSQILQHIQNCLTYKVTAKAFLSLYFHPPFSSPIINDSVITLDQTESLYRERRFHCGHYQRQHPSLLFDRISNVESNRNRKNVQNSNLNVFQTWKIRIRGKPKHWHIYDGLKFELVRSDQILFCHVHEIPQIELHQSKLSYNLNNFEVPFNLPASTVETYLGSSENTTEIKL